MKKDMANIVNEEWSLVKEIGEARFLINMPNSNRDYHKNLGILKNVTQKEDSEISHQSMKDEGVVLGYLKSHVKGEDPFEQPFQVNQKNDLKKQTLDLKGFDVLENPIEPTEEKIIEEVKKISQKIRLEQPSVEIKKEIIQPKDKLNPILKTDIDVNLDLNIKQVQANTHITPPYFDTEKNIQNISHLNHAENYHFKESEKHDVDKIVKNKKEHYPSWMEDKKKTKFSLELIYHTYLETIDYYTKFSKIKYDSQYFIFMFLLVSLPMFSTYGLIKATNVSIWSCFVLYFANIFIGISIHTMLKVIKKINH